jgi:hypothetical protein
VYGTLSRVLTHDEATERAALIDTITCDVTLDLTVSPPRSRTVLRFRCGVARPYPKYDIVFHRELRALALSVPGLMVVNAIVLDRMADPEGDFATELARHEGAHHR